jgi:hypothetical protein
VPSFRQLFAGFPQQRTGFEAGTVHVGFVVDIAALVWVSSEYFGFPCQSFHRLLHTHYHPLSGVGRIGQLVALVILDSFPLHYKKQKKKC